MKSNGMVLLVAMLGLLLIVSAAAGQTEQQKKKSLVDIASEAMDESAAKAVEPGEYHELLEKMAGSWTYTGRMWMQPGAPPVELSGTSENKMILGGRYLRQEVSSVFFGQEFNGLGYIGYDNTLGKFQSAWMDNMSTGMIHSHGQGDLDKKTITNYGQQTDPRTGLVIKFRSVTTIKSDKEFLDQWFHIDENGEESINMELVYKRK